MFLVSGSISAALLPFIHWRTRSTRCRQRFRLFRQPEPSLVSNPGNDHAWTTEREEDRQSDALRKPGRKHPRKEMVYHNHSDWLSFCLFLFLVRTLHSENSRRLSLRRSQTSTCIHLVLECSQTAWVAEGPPFRIPSTSGKLIIRRKIRGMVTKVYENMWYIYMLLLFSLSLMLLLLLALLLLLLLLS